VQSYIAATGSTFPIVRLGQYLQSPSYYGIYYDNYLVIDAQGIVRYTSVNETFTSAGRFNDAHLRSAILGVATDVSGGPATGLALRVTSPVVTGGEAWLFLGAPAGAGARLRLFDVAGRSLRTLPLPSGGGWSSLAWKVADAGGRPLPAGVYWLRFEERGGPARTSKLVVLRQ
jgi:hypothetical protein